MIYWADTQTHAIARGRMDGSGAAQALYQAGLAEPWDIEVASAVPEPGAALFITSLATAQLLRRRREIEQKTRRTGS